MNKRLWPVLLALVSVSGHVWGQGDLLTDTIDTNSFNPATSTVGRTDHGGLITPVNQLVTPAGTPVDLPDIRPQAIALSPNGKLLVTAGLTPQLIVLDPATGKILQRVDFPPGQTPGLKPITAAILAPDEKAQLSFTGLLFSPDGSRLYLSNVTGDIKVFAVDAAGQVSALRSLPLPPTGMTTRTNDIPAGLALSKDGRKLYVVLNFSDRLAELDTATGNLLRIWPVGSAPFDVTLVGHKAYVSNWAGRRPVTGSLTGPSGLGTAVRVDARSIASEGSVSILDLGQPVATALTGEIVIGPHACALALSPNGRWLVAASAGSDMLSVIDTRNDEVAETICARQNPGDLFGAQPNALAFDRSGKKLYVCNGTQNAVAVFQFKPGESTLLGLIPVGWFPGAIVVDHARRQLDVANIKSLPAHPQPAKKADGLGFNTHQYTGSLSLVPVPDAKTLAHDTDVALENIRYPLLAQAKLPARPDRPAQPVPERVGEPSVFQHVIYIIKENRTYDQVLGDLSEGNGDPHLCNFGERVTPNLHQISRDFVLLDNTYCASILSADGHNWADSGIATDYLEREFAGWPRSYPAGGFGQEGRDALAYSPAGFIWDDALAHHRTVVDFGEYTSSSKTWLLQDKSEAPNFLDCYRDFTNGTHQIAYRCEPDIESLRPYLAPGYIGWDLDVPDVWREAQFAHTFHQYETNGNLPGLVIVWLPNDHTSGTKHGSPTPSAQVADNDLAVGRLVDAVSHSAYWKNTAIFAIEDDPQNGWDHVSGYRTTAFVASAYTRRHTVVNTQYNQTSLLRTMELILGLPPMNQMDATATPMFDCFTNVPDFTPYTAVANQTPLDQMNPRRFTDAQLRSDALVSDRLQLAKPDQCPEDVLNRILWRATMGTQIPYPNWAVKTVDDD